MQRAAGSELEADFFLFDTFGCSPNPSEEEHWSWKEKSDCGMSTQWSTQALLQSNLGRTIANSILPLKRNGKVRIETRIGSDSMWS